MWNRNLISDLPITGSMQKSIEDVESENMVEWRSQVRRRQRYQWKRRHDRSKTQIQSLGILKFKVGVSSTRPIQTYFKQSVTYLTSSASPHNTGSQWRRPEFFSRGHGRRRTGSEVRGDKVIQKWKPSGVRSAKFACIRKLQGSTCPSAPCLTKPLPLAKIMVILWAAFLHYFAASAHKIQFTTWRW